MEHKISEVDRSLQRSQFMRNLDKSEIFHSQDMFDRDIQITYAKGCIRNLDKQLTKKEVHRMPNFGTILTDDKNEYETEKFSVAYRNALALSVLKSYFYDMKISGNIPRMTPEMADYIIMRYYPSNSRFTYVTDYGCVTEFLNDGEPKPRLKEIELMYSKDPDVRKDIFKRLLASDSIDMGNMKRGGHGQVVKKQSD